MVFVTSFRSAVFILINAFCNVQNNLENFKKFQKRVKNILEERFKRINYAFLLPFN